MIKKFLILNLVLLSLLFSWCLYEKMQWPIDYLAFPVQTIRLGPLDNTFEQHINPQLFSNATIITNETHLKLLEDIAVTNNGTIYSGLTDGTVVRIDANGSIEKWVEMKEVGAIYGITLNTAETILYCVTEDQGLVEVDLVSRVWTSLLKEFRGERLILNSVCLNSHETVLYFSWTGPVSMRFSTKQVFLKHHKGSILSFDLETKEVEIVAKGLAYPNGIAFEERRQAVLFSELNHYRIVRLYVDGPRKGESEVLIDNLFGTADNLKINANGDLLVGIPATRDAVTDYLGEQPTLRKMLMWLPEILVYAMVRRRAGGIKIDTRNGVISEYIFGPTDRISFVTTILEKNGRTYFSGLVNPTIVLLDDSAKRAAQLGASQSEL